MYIPPTTSDLNIPVKRLQFDTVSGALVATNKKKSFIRGPIPLEWLGKAAALPGKTLNVALAIWWLHGMSGSKPFKLTRRALNYMNVEREAASAGLLRLEQVGLIRVERKSGQRPTIEIVSALRPSIKQEQPYNELVHNDSLGHADKMK